MKKIHLIEDKIKLKYLLGTYLKSGRYSCYEDALYDVIYYLQEKDSQTITSSNIHYALKIKTDVNYVDEFMQWAISNSYFDLSESGKKKTYTLVKSPFK